MLATWMVRCEPELTNSRRKRHQMLQRWVGESIRQFNSALLLGVLSQKRPLQKRIEASRYTSRKLFHARVVQGRMVNDVLSTSAIVPPLPVACCSVTLSTSVNSAFVVAFIIEVRSSELNVLALIMSGTIMIILPKKDAREAFPMSRYSPGKLIFGFRFAKQPSSLAGTSPPP